MASIKFYLDHPKVGGKLKAQRVRVYLRVTIDRARRIDIKTDLQARPVNWDFKNGMAKASTAAALNFNNELLTIERRAMGVLLKHSQHPFDVMRSALKNEFKPRVEARTFWEVYALFLEIRKNEVEARTHAKYRGLKKVLAAFEATYKPITFESIDLRFYDQYVHWLLSERKNPKRGKDAKGLLNDSASKHIENLKTFLNWAAERDYHHNFAFKKFKNRRTKKLDNVVLTLDELRTLYAHDFAEVPRLDRVRDVFCFQVFTGQRLGDIKRFDKKQLAGEVWTFTQAKNEAGHPVTVSVPLVGFSRPALDILKKYNYKLPIISDQKYNDYIKEVAEAAEINTVVTLTRRSGENTVRIEREKWGFISSHTARRTCITILLALGVPVQTLMKITGHTKIETLMKYENMDDTAVVRELQRVGELGRGQLQKVN